MFKSFLRVFYVSSKQASSLARQQEQRPAFQKVWNFPRNLPLGGKVWEQIWGNHPFLKEASSQSLWQPTKNQVKWRIGLRRVPLVNKQTGICCRVWLCLGLWFLVTPFLKAQDITEDQKRRASEFSDSEFGGMPLLFRTPETGWAFGGVLLHTSDLDKKRPSPIISGLMYTEKKQILWGIGARKILSDQDKSLYTYAEFARFPQIFYGVGRETDRQNATRYEENREVIEFGGDHEIIPHLSFGAGFIIRNDRFESSMPDGQGLLGKKQFFGEEGGPQRGAQIYGLWESTDDNYFPTQGYKVQLFQQSYFGGWGSRYPFQGQKLDARHYTLIKRDWIQAFHIFAQSLEGDVPFYQLAQMGGNDLLRGYYKGRYRDRKMLILQTESRYRLAKYWNAAVFFGAGNVAPDWQAFFKQDLKPSYGAGLRYQISPKQKVHVRLDIGFGEDQGGPQTYLYVMEAF